jgi:hypothetical protein
LEENVAALSEKWKDVPSTHHGWLASIRDEVKLSSQDLKGPVRLP